MFFGSAKKRVTKEEFKKVRSLLYGKGFTIRELDEIEKIFHGDLHEEEEYNKGIDVAEIERGVTWLRENDNHIVSKSKLDILEEVLKSKL